MPFLLEDAIIETCLADTQLTALIGQRIVASPELEQSTSYPAVNLRMVSDVPTFSHGGDSGRSVARVQFDIYGTCQRDVRMVGWHFTRMFSARRSPIGVSQNMPCFTQQLNAISAPKEPGRKIFHFIMEFSFAYNRRIDV